MFETNDRGIRTIRPLVIAALIVLAASAAGGGWWFFARHRAQQPESAEQPLAPAPAAQTEFIALTGWLPQSGILSALSFTAQRMPDLQTQARAALSALLGTARAAQAPVLMDLRLRALYLDGAGTAYLDLGPNQEFRTTVAGSAHDEFLAVYALVNTMTRNFPEIRQVRLLFDGKEAATLAGHADLSRSYLPREDAGKQ